jgi:hypothetical protein
MPVAVMEKDGRLILGKEQYSPDEAVSTGILLDDTVYSPDSDQEAAIFRMALQHGLKWERKAPSSPYFRPDKILTTQFDSRAGTTTADVNFFDRERTYQCSWHCGVKKNPEGVDFGYPEVVKEALTGAGK